MCKMRNLTENIRVAAIKYDYIINIIKQAQKCKTSETVQKYIVELRNEPEHRTHSSRYDFDFSVRIDTLEKVHNEISLWYDYIKAFIK